ncbi:MAG: antitoxin [Sphingomonas sp.]
MGAIETKTFKSGNSVAVRLPKELGFAADQKVTIEAADGVLTIRPVDDAAAEKRKLTALVEQLREIWADAPAHEIGRREPIDIPERPGL